MLQADLWLGGTVMSNREGEPQLVRLQQEETHSQPAVVAALVKVRIASRREWNMVDRRRKEEQRIKFFRFKHLLPLQNSVRRKVPATPSGDKDPALLTSAFLPYKFSCF